jgi:hypothetical protein
MIAVRGSATGSDGTVVMPAPNRAPRVRELAPLSRRVRTDEGAERCEPIGALANRLDAPVACGAPAPAVARPEPRGALVGADADAPTGTATGASSGEPQTLQ